MELFCMYPGSELEEFPTQITITCLLAKCQTLADFLKFC